MFGLTNSCYTNKDNDNNSHNHNHSTTMITRDCKAGDLKMEPLSFAELLRTSHKVKQRPSRPEGTVTSLSSVCFGTALFCLFRHTVRR